MKKKYKKRKISYIPGGEGFGWGIGGGGGGGLKAIEFVIVGSTSDWRFCEDGAWLLVFHVMEFENRDDCWKEDGKPICGLKPKYIFFC